MLTKTGAPTQEPLQIGTNGSPPEAGAVRIDAVAHSFGELLALDGLDLNAAPHEVLGIVGPSGLWQVHPARAGRRTARAGLGEDRGRGRGQKARERLQRCAYMPQRDLLLPWMTALDNAALALRNRGVRRAAARAQAAPLFERFGLAGFEGSHPNELSGGMRQRVAFLRTLVAGKPVLLLDEPFASLDAITRGEMQAWLGGALAENPRTVIFVTHDVEEALYLSDRVAVLSARPGRVTELLETSDPRAADRAAAITSPRFVAQRESAMRALAEGARNGG